jgi:hypothetical protein
VALLQKISRRLLRWYIDPLVEEQNTFNAAVAQSLEEFYRQIVALRLQLELTDQGAPEQTEKDILATAPLPAEPDLPLQHRLRLAFFTPLSPLKTAVADHSEGLLSPMGDYADIDLYIDDGYQPNNPNISERFAIYNHREFPDKVHDYDAVLYAMGDNADSHGYVYDMLQRFPGVVILHDSTLHRFMIGHTLHHGDTDGYLEEMEYAYGIGDLRTAEQVLSGYGESLITRYPLIERVLDLAQGIIVHT